MNFNDLFLIINFLLFHLYFPILWLVYFSRYFLGKSWAKIFKISLISYGLIVVLTVSLGSLLLYQQWSGHAIYSYLLPPHSYYFYTVIIRTLAFHLVGVAVGLALYFILKLLVKLIRAFFIDPKEIKLFAIGAVLVGSNNVIFYICLTVVLMLLSSVFLNLFKVGRGKRVALLPYVLFSLIITLLIGYKVSLFWGIY